MNEFEFLATKSCRFLDWLEAHTTGKSTWPWAQSWSKFGVTFMFAAGSHGFCLVLPLPRWLPGFVRPYQVNSLKTREGRRDSDLHLFVPLFPIGWWHTSRTRRLRKRS